MTPVAKGMRWLICGGMIWMLVCPAGAKENDAPSVVAATDQAALAQNIGQIVAVEGVVKSTGRGAAGELIFLNFTAGKDGFSAALVPAVHADAGDPADYVGLRLRIIGTLLSHKGTPQIKVSRMAQIEVQGD